MPVLPSPIKDLCSRFKHAYGRSELSKLQRWLKGNTLHWSVFLVLSCSVLGSLLCFHYYRYSHFYAVRIDGAEVGLVREVEKAEQLLEDLTGKCTALYKMELFPEQEITLNREYRPEGVENVQAIKEALMNRLSFLTDAVMVTVDGVPVAPVSSAEEVDRVKEMVRFAFVKEDEQIELLEVELLEEISGEQCTVSPGKVYAPNELAFLLTRPKAGRGLQVASRAALPSRFGRNKPDERSVTAVPEVHVKTVEKVTVEERIPFVTRYRSSNEMYTGESRVVFSGEDGLKETTYRVIRENGVEQSRENLSSRVITEPKDRIIERGTRKRFAWPVSAGGKITQRFHAGHRGIDIAAPLNTPILAAESGVVVRAERGSSQGNYVVINHGGYYTLYLHNNANLVSPGQRVSRGQVIARLGSTGRSTGPHLHFEIRRSSGSCWGGWNTHPPINPLQFF